MVFRARKAGAEKLPAAPGTSDAMLPLATLDESKN
jgi:hypothetical protein